MWRQLSIVRWLALCSPILTLTVLASPTASAAVQTHPLPPVELTGVPPLQEPQTEPAIEGEEGSFEDACGVALDSHGDVYVSDYYHDAIDVYHSNRATFEYLTQISRESTDNGPCGLAVDSEGRIYVNNWRHEVIRLTPSSYPPGHGTTYAAETLIDPGPSTGLAIDPDSGDLYVDDGTSVAEYKACGVQKLDRAGKARADPPPKEFSGLVGQAVVAFVPGLTT